MQSRRELEFERHMNELRLKSLDRMAAEVNPWSEDFNEIEQEIRKLQDRQRGIEMQVRAIALSGGTTEANKTVLDTPAKST